jgi:histidyl-tRNA synthetase
VAADSVRAVGLRDLELRVGHIGIVKALVDAAGLDELGKGAVFPALDKKDFARLEDFLKTANVAEAMVKLILDCARFTGGHEQLAVFAARLADIPAAHAAVARLLAALKALERRGVTHAKVDLGVVRGLDYYTGVVFELHSPHLGAESQCGGGGAYALADIFEMPPEGTAGFGLGFDRLVLLVAETDLPASEGAVEALVVPIGAAEAVLDLAAKAETALRAGGVRVERDLLGRGPSKALKYAAARGARIAILVGDREAADGRVTYRDLNSGEQTLLLVHEAVTRAQTALGCA